jgi:hypothetical protein
MSCGSENLKISVQLFGGKALINELYGSRLHVTNHFPQYTKCVATHLIYR